MKQVLMSCLVATLSLAGACANASTVTLVNSQISNGGIANNQWNRQNVGGSAVAVVNGVNARSGNGSVQLGTANSGGKADYVYTWGFATGRTLGNLNTLAFDWYKSSSSTNTAVAPAFRLSYDADGSASTTGDRGYLIYEPVYNGAITLDSWNHIDLMQAEFWQRQFTPTKNIESYDVTLAQWLAGSQPTGADILGANTAITGIEFGVGSGWSGTFNGFVDNVSFGFANQGSTTFNFEASVVPEPGSALLVGLGLLALARSRKRRA